ncbi:MAG: hypothetical protein WKF76_02205 [Nocardioidaceae bacterium]
MWAALEAGDRSTFVVLSEPPADASRIVEGELRFLLGELLAEALEHRRYPPECGAAAIMTPQQICSDDGSRTA